MSDDETVNELFKEDECINLEEHLWGKNPQRARALKELWFDIMNELVNEDDKPEEAKREMIFLMTANNVMDMIMEAIPEEVALELSMSLDSVIGLSLVNRRYDVDLLESNYKTLIKIKREDYASDEEFEQAVRDVDERWWTVGKQALGGRSPNDAIIEELSKYSLNR